MNTLIRGILTASAVLALCCACTSTDTQVQATPASSVTVRQGPETEVTPEAHDGNPVVLTAGTMSIYCNPDAGGVQLPLDGEVNDFIGIVKVHQEATYTQVEWDKPTAYIVIVNHTKWGYVNKSGGPTPVSSRLPVAKWGSIKDLKVCGAMPKINTGGK